MGGLFGPQFLAKLAMNPETRPFLEQPDFKQMLASCGKNPELMSSYLQACCRLHSTSQFLRNCYCSEPPGLPLQQPSACTSSRCQCASCCRAAVAIKQRHTRTRAREYNHEHLQDKRFAKALEVGLGISMGFGGDGDAGGAGDDGNEVDGPGLTSAQERGAPGASAGTWRKQEPKREPAKAPEPNLTAEKEKKDGALEVRL